MFDKLIDVNEASERYNLTPQAIKQHIGGKLKEGIDCKKFGNSWVFIKTNLDIIFRDRLKEEDKFLLESDREELSKIGEKLMKTYKDKFGKEKAKQVCLDMNDYIHNNDKSSFIYTFFEKCLNCDGIDLSNLSFYTILEYYPESCYCILFGMNNGVNKEDK